MIFIGYKKCSTCKKAEEYLKEMNLEYTYRHIKEDNPTKEELKNFLLKSNLPIKRFFNTSGQVYRDLNLKDKLPNLSLDEKLSLLATNGMLCKRPILVTDNNVLVGFKIKEWDLIFKG